MKKIFLSLVVASSIAISGDYSFEATIAGGKTHFAPKLADTGINAVRTAHFGWQFNELNSPIKPQLALDMTSGSHYKNSSARTRSNRAFLNGVYELLDENIIPYLLLGLGREDVKNVHHNSFNDTALANIGAGVKIALFADFSLKLEGRYMKRLGTGGGYEKVLLAGLNIGIGGKPAQIISKDDDNDGVLNLADRCPNTVAGTRVDASGCKIITKKIVGDNDKDGILNNIDRCPNTPAGTHVNRDGCEPPKKVVKKVLDSDNDGVEDSVDRCPSTARDAVVDSNGCIQIIKIRDVKFRSGSARINQKYLVDLKKVIRYLNKNTQIKIEIAGHTDSRGSKRYNQKLSQRRADSVKKYLISRGISKSRVSSAGYGESRPIAQNNTANGRSKNRRIEAEVYNR